MKVFPKFPRNPPSRNWSLYIFSFILVLLFFGVYSIAQYKRVLEYEEVGNWKISEGSSSITVKGTAKKTYLCVKECLIEGTDTTKNIKVIIGLGSSGETSEFCVTVPSKENTTKITFGNGAKELPVKSILQ